MRNLDYDPEAPGWIDPHPPERLSDLAGKQWKFEPEGDPPEPRQQECALCHCRFSSNAQWLLTRWSYPNVCVHCGDNYSQREQVIHAKRPRTIFIPNPGPKKIICCGCHEQIFVHAVKDGAYWLYKGPCPICGIYFENLWYAYKAVPELGKEEGAKPRKDPDDID